MGSNVIDLAVFEELKRSVGDDFIGELTDTFLTDAPKLIAEMHRCLKDNQVDTFRRTAHSLKSTSANFGATQLSALAKDLEMVGKSGTLDGAADKMPRLENEYRRVVDELKRLVK